jgi:hypothetical protein
MMSTPSQRSKPRPDKMSVPEAMGSMDLNPLIMKSLSDPQQPVGSRLPGDGIGMPAPPCPPANEAGVTITIVPHHHVAILDQPDARLQPLLSHVRRTFISDGPLGHRMVEQPMTECMFDHRDRLAFSAGLVPRIRRAMESYGYGVTIVDQRQPDVRMTVDPAVVSIVTTAEASMLETVAREPLGQVEIAGDDDAIRLCVMVTQAFPTARFVVGVGTRRQAQQVWDRMSKELAEPVGLFVAGVWRHGDRVLVATYAGIPPDHVQDGDVLLLPFGEQAAGQRVVNLASGLRFARVYAFVRPQRRPDRLLQLHLEAMAGPVIRRLKKRCAPVRVVVLPVATGKTTISGRTALQHKKVAYWHNFPRNRLIAAIAKAAAANDRQVLQQAGFRPEDLLALRDPPGAVVVLVESPAHGRRIQGLLAGWSLVSMAPVTGKETVNVPMPAVVTAANAATHGVPADVIIRATGTEWPLRIKNFPGRQGRNAPAEVLVVDFADEFDLRAVQDAERRVAEYRRCGMNVVTAVPAASE